MGMTLSSVHVYSAEAITGMGNFLSLSDGWQTYMPETMPDDLFELRRFAKKLSAKVTAPVLWFYIFDDEAIWFELYRNGKRVSAYSSQELTGTKHLYEIPALIGYDAGQKRRLSRILSCADMDYVVEMLEEYFGVCLLICPEMMDEPPEVFHRERCDTKYRQLLEEDKQISGKQSPIKAELIFEEKGKLFEHHFGEHGTFRPHHYYFGYSTWLPSSGDLRPVRFCNGRITDVSQAEFDAVEPVPTRSAREDERFAEEYYPVYKVVFTDKAPEGFRGKTLIPPRGYYFYWFDGKNRIILTDEKGGILFIDESLKVIAKLRLKGQPVDFVDGHILTAGSNSFFAYCYHPQDFVRIYKLTEV